MKLIIAMALGAAFMMAQSAPSIYGRDGKYLGKLSANPYDPASVSNPYGRYGSQYSPDSINNPYGKYGSPYSPYSATNPYTTQAPVIVAPTNPVILQPVRPFEPIMPLGLKPIGQRGLFY